MRQENFSKTPTGMSYLYRTLPCIPSAYSLLRRNLPEVFVQFLEDTIDAIGINMVSLTEQELKTVVSNASAFAFDFDDAYQYSVAEKYDFTLISFDTDFDRSKRGRKSPADVS